VFNRQRAQTRRAQDEEAAARRVESQPPRGQHSQEMPAGKEEYGAVDGARPVQDVVRSRSDVIHRLSPRRSVTEDIPAGTSRQDVFGGQAFIVAVIPFDQVAIDFRPLSETGQFACVASALQGAGKDAREFQSFEPFSQAARVTFAPLCEWQVSEPCVLSAQRPRGFAVAGKVDCLMRSQWFSP